MTWPFEARVESLDELRELVREPGKLVQNKELDRLDVHCASLIRLAPFVVLATSDADGNCDVSPRGDAPGFVQILSGKHLLLPDRPGNRRLDSMRNILQNPRVGLIFVIPGMDETLRVNGRACIVRDEQLLARSAVNDRVPKLGIGIEVEEAFIHCAKAFRRASLWDPEGWPSTEGLPSIAQMLLDHANLDDQSVEDIDELLRNDYAQNMY